MNTENILISIVVPCYQSEKTIERTVRSIQRQTYTRWELIAVDDGSHDDTLSVIEQLALQEPRMRVIHQENGGVSSARNAGQDTARGEWITFVDADDHLLPHALEHLLSLTDEQTDIVCGAYDMRYCDEGGRVEKHTCADGDLQTMLESLIRGDSALNSPCARLYRLSMLREHGVYAPLGVKIGEDVLYNLDAFVAARGWRISEETIYIYEFGGDSAMNRAKSDRYAKNSRMIEGIDSFLDRNHLNTALFRAHIDIYVRMLRADFGRPGAAFALKRKMVSAMTRNVEFKRLTAKEKLYYIALKILPAASFLLP